MSTPAADGAPHAAARPDPADLADRGNLADRGDPGERADLADLVAAARELLVAVGLTDVEGDELRRATAAVGEITSTLRARSRTRVIRDWIEDPAGGPLLPTGESVFGSLNPFAVPLRLERVGENAMAATGRLHPLVEGPSDSVHGGYLAMVVDSVMGQLVKATGGRAVTGTLSLRYLHRTPLDDELRFTAEVVERTGRRVLVHGEVASGDLVTVRAEGVFVTVR